MKNKKAFTLIELIAVLVILAILALIVTPIVLNIVKRSNESANKRSVDAYGKSIELAIANYLLDKGKFPTNISDLEIEYSGKEVICNISILNEDSSVYLSECKVGSSDVKDKNTSDGWYHYGKSTKATYKAYKIGDEVTYNGINFYVIKNSDENSDSVTLLKEEPLTVDEVNKYGANKINKYSNNNRGKAYNYNGYGGMTYSSTSTCGSDNHSNCTTEYDKSDVKRIVDAWSLDKLKANDLKEDKTGYSTRLITYEELQENLEYDNIDSSGLHVIGSKTYADLMYSNDWYWTMTPYQDYNNLVWFVTSGHLAPASIYVQGAAVRPVITLKKDVI